MLEQDQLSFSQVPQVALPRFNSLSERKREGTGSFTSFSVLGEESSLRMTAPLREGGMQWKDSKGKKG